MNNSNFIVAVALSIAILIGFQYFYEQPRIEAAQQQHLMQKLAKEVKPPPKEEVAVVRRERQAIISEGKRVKIDTPELKGSINLKGARIDDLSLINYQTTADQNSQKIVLLSPVGSADPDQPYYAEFGWLGENLPVPDNATEWQSDTKELSVSKPVHLTWNNGQGLLFERTIAIDEHFMFTITDRVKNSSNGTVLLYPFGLIARHGKPQTQDLFIMHEGPMGALNGTISEYKYKDLMSKNKIVTQSDGGWIGFTDKYWLVALIPSQDEKISASFTYDRGSDPNPDKGLFQSDFRSTPVSLASGATAEKRLHLFAGAKSLRMLDQYAGQLNIPHFDRSIDFGWFYFLTKPFLYLLDYLGSVFGNFGLAILAFTVLLKLATMPLSLKSYRSMARLKEIQPELQKIQEKYKEDKMAQSAQMMELYKREKVSPMSGCLPNLIQIPIFFALYKVLFVSIEMRHAPFYGWIHDLSAADPTSVLTLFGTLPWSFMPHLGVWPLLMGISMFMQQKLSPQPPDKTQARMFLFLPIIFTFMLSQVAAGLVIYWTLSNLLGIGQQWFIMKRSGIHRK
ncbi:MAG: membrane protein insertase YidC [Alphaproteobacteria bacterium]|nr:membrane protein insertase YidC [Alphaproteobacteria bacterium]